MQELTIKSRVANFKLGKYEEFTETKVVASTKSQNNLIEEMKIKQNKDVFSVVAKDFYLTKKDIDNGVNAMVDNANIKEELKPAVKEHLYNVLKNGCLTPKEKQV